MTVQSLPMLSIAVFLSIYLECVQILTSTLNIVGVVLLSAKCCGQNLTASAAQLLQHTVPNAQASPSQSLAAAHPQNGTPTARQKSTQECFSQCSMRWHSL